MVFCPSSRWFSLWGETKTTKPLFYVNFMEYWPKLKFRNENQISLWKYKDLKHILPFMFYLFSLLCIWILIRTFNQRIMLLTPAECSAATFGEPWAMCHDIGVQEGVWQEQCARFPLWSLRCWCWKLSRWWIFWVQALASTWWWCWDCEGQDRMEAKTLKQKLWSCFESGSCSSRKHLNLIDWHQWKSGIIHVPTCRLESFACCLKI